MRRSILFVGVLLLFSGCLAGPFGEESAQSESVPVIVETSENLTQSYTFETWVIELPANVTVHRSDGVVYSMPVGVGSSTYDSGDYHNYTSIDVPESANLLGRHALAPGERNRSVLRPEQAPGNSDGRFPDRFAIVIIVYESPNNIPAWKSNSDCDEMVLTGVSVTMREYGTDSSFGCR